MSAVLWGVLGLLAAGAMAAVLLAAVKSGRPMRSLLSSGLGGLCALAAVNVTGAVSGVSLGLGWFSGVCCLLLGLPAVVAMLLLKVIFGL